MNFIVSPFFQFKICFIKPLYYIVFKSFPFYAAVGVFHQQQPNVLLLMAGEESPVTVLISRRKTPVLPNCSRLPFEHAKGCCYNNHTHNAPPE